MKQQNIKNKKNRKNFYALGFKRAVNLLLVSVILNLLLSTGIHNRLIRIPEPKFYATDGIAAPILLTPLDGPNKSSEPLLPDDPPEEMPIRELPENI